MVTGSQDSEMKAAKSRGHSLTSMVFSGSKQVPGPAWVPEEGVQAPPLHGKSGLNLQPWEELWVTLFSDNLLLDRKKSDAKLNILLENRSN